MTNVEALALKTGDKVEFNSGSGWKPATIKNIKKSGSGMVQIKLTCRGAGHKMPNTYNCALPYMVRKVKAE